MKPRAAIFAGIFALTVFLAFVLRDVVEAAIIVPLAYLWWLIKIYYAALPQGTYWVFLAVIVFYSAITNLIPKVNARAAPKAENKLARGQVETLADWLKKSKRGTYYKWLIANRLGKAARELLAQREGNPVSKKFSALSGRGWNPPEKIDSYLNIGLNGSFANVPRARWFWQSPPPTQLDVDLQQVINYLEDEMEMTDGRDHKSI